eukprot:m.49007 g.49007  ORF g.49007 m.49007 type:complete len:371 (+) comp17864_c2_seq2:114-1226(+)
MMRVLCVVAVVVALAVAQHPPRPEIPDSYEAAVDVEQHTRNETLFGEGEKAIDAEDKKALERARIHEPQRQRTFYVEELERFDIGKEYEIASYDPSKCTTKTISKDFPHPFEWVKNATYDGRHEHRHRPIDVWVANTAGVKIGLGVSPDDPNTPVVFFRQDSHEEYREYYREFRAGKPRNASIFNVPPQCTAEHGVTVADPPKPKISDDFFADIEFRVFAHRGNRSGIGRQGSDLSAGKFVEEIRYPEEHNFTEFLLQRFDLHEEFLISSEDRHDCHERPTEGSTPKPWGFLDNAKYGGKKECFGQSCDTWVYNTAGIYLALGVTEDQPDVPVFLGRDYKGEKTEIRFVKFNAGAPESKYFDVPEECRHH